MPRLFALDGTRRRIGGDRVVLGRRAACTALAIDGALGQSAAAALASPRTPPLLGPDALVPQGLTSDLMFELALFFAGETTVSASLFGLTD